MPDSLLSIIAGRDKTGLIEVRCRNPRSGQITARGWFDVTAHGECRAFIAERSPKLDVYVGAAPRTRCEGGKSAISHAWCLWIDADSNEALGRIAAFRPEPSLVVRSGSGDNAHAYWALAEPLSPEWVERANRRLAHHLGADMKATDAARILRPPGSLNHKHDPPVKVTAVGSLGLDRYMVASLVAQLADPPNFRPSEPRSDFDADDPLMGVSADRYYTTLTSRPVAHGNVTCPFPAHNGGNERTPSMRLYERTFFCFGCGVGGSIFEFAACLWGYELPLRCASFKEVQTRLGDAL